MRVETYRLLQTLITHAGFGDDVTWAENVGECESADEFAREHAFVVCNSGMRAKTACGIFRKVQVALSEGRPLLEVFGHEHKCYSIQHVYDHRQELFAKYKEVVANDRTETKEEVMAFLRTLPHIGPTIVFHLAKNMGLNIAKPDRHLQRIAAFYETTPHELCRRLSEKTGLRIATIDTIIWRAASLEIITYTDNFVPLIPSWPYDVNTVEFNCPHCGVPHSSDISGVREKGFDFQLCQCGSCDREFCIEPGVNRVRVVTIAEYTGVEAETPAQLSFFEDGVESEDVIVSG